MKNFIKGILSIGVLIPPSFSITQNFIQNSWDDVLKDFSDAGNDIKESLNEQKLYTTN